MNEIIRYRKPIYDPFEIFKPSKAFLKEVLKQLRDRCYELQKEKILFFQNTDSPEWLKDLFEEAILRELKTLQSRIKFYVSVTSGERQNNRGITQMDIDRARQRPIADLFTGKLRCTGQRFIGICPFHSEKTGSFVLYPNNTFYCFGCNAHGDSIDFLMKNNNITSFIEAVKHLK